jgi:hypothetical protein
MYSNNEQILNIPCYLFLHQCFSRSQHPTAQREWEPDVHESVHHDTIMKVTNKMQL